MKAILVRTCGGPEQLQVHDLPVPVPGPGQALVKIAAAGVNFIDIYYRTGLYKASLPAAIGMEASGTVEAVGPDAPEVAVGDRVAYALSRGSYAEYAVVPSAMLVKLPDQIDFETGAAAMLQGLTAHYLAVSTYPLKEGVTALIHAAAGGVGLLLVQIAKMRGARVLGTVSTQAKADQALEAATTSSRRSAASPAAAAWTWSTTPWAPPRFSRGSTCFAPAAPWSPTGSPAAPSRRSIRSYSARRDRSS
jgi:NADPH2:quinone reductase